jgi:hypothetical protein
MEVRRTKKIITFVNNLNNNINKNVEITVEIKKYISTFMLIK